MEKVSVIIPAYNAEKTIETSICSVIENTYPNIEILVIDDGSADCTSKIVKRLQKKDGRVILIQKENGGVSSARNRGIQEASGDILMFLDSDDLYEKEYCEAVVESMRKYHSDVVISGYQEIFSQEVHFRECPIQEVLSSQKGIYEKLIKNHYLSGINGYLGSVWLAGFKRKIIIENNLRFHEGIHRAEDKLFLVQYLLKCQRLSVISKPMYRYMLGDASATKNYSATMEENHELLSIEWEKMMKQAGYEETMDMKGREAVSNVISLLVNEARRGNPQPFSQKVKNSFSFNKKYRKDMQKFHPDSRTMKIKKMIAQHSVLCVGFFCVRRIQCLMGVYF